MDEASPHAEHEPPPPPAPPRQTKKTKRSGKSDSPFDRAHDVLDRMRRDRQ